MNYIAAIALWLVLHPQELKCPAGKVAWGGMASSSMIVERGCYTPEEMKATELDFAKNVCEETGSGGGNWTWWYSDKHEFIDGHCVETETYFYRTRRGKIIPVSRDTYMRGTCGKWMFDDGKGHVETYPKSEWKECLK